MQRNTLGIRWADMCLGLLDIYLQVPWGWDFQRPWRELRAGDRSNTDPNPNAGPMQATPDDSRSLRLGPGACLVRGCPLGITSGGWQEALAAVQTRAATLSNNECLRRSQNGSRRACGCSRVGGRSPLGCGSSGRCRPGQPHPPGSSAVTQQHGGTALRPPGPGTWGSGSGALQQRILGGATLLPHPGRRSQGRHLAITLGAA